MTALRVSAALLRAAVAANALRSPVPPHHREAYATLAHGGNLLTAGDRWFLESVVRLPAVSERQLAKLRSIAATVELGR